MSKYQHVLQGGDLRSTDSANEVVAAIHTQEEFDELFLDYPMPTEKLS